MYAQIPVTIETSTGVATPTDLEMLVDDVMEQLVDLERFDIDIAATLTEARFDFCVHGLDDEEPDFNSAWSAVRTALHAAGVSTPGWELAQARWTAVLKSIELVPA